MIIVPRGTASPPVSLAVTTTQAVQACIRLFIQQTIARSKLPDRIQLPQSLHDDQELCADVGQGRANLSAMITLHLKLWNSLIMGPTRLQMSTSRGITEAVEPSLCIHSGRHDLI